MSFNLSDYLEATDPPHWLTHNSAWIYHIPMAAVLMKMLRPRSFVELGTFRGDSYMAFCQAAAKLDTPVQCTAVDNWRGDAHAGFYGPAVLDELRATHDPLYGHFSRLLQSDFSAALADFPDGSIDLLHLDGHHTYEAARHDFESWLPKLSDRAVVLLHDTQVREKDFGVWKLWREISSHQPAFDIPYGCGLGMLAIGAHVPKKFLAFIHELNTNPLPILTQFQTLGVRIELLRTVMALVNDLHHTQTALNDWRKFSGQTILQATPNLKAAWDNPRRYAMTITAQTRELVTDARRLASEVIATENQLAARIGIVQEVVHAAEERGTLTQST